MQDRWVCFCEVGMADFGHRRKNSLHDAVHVDLCMLLSLAVFVTRFTGALLFLIFVQPGRVYLFLSVAG